MIALQEIVRVYTSEVLLSNSLLSVFMNYMLRLERFV
jgi:hypothetical protein